MIAVSDGVLILVSAVVLGTGLLRWQGNVNDAMQANVRPAIATQVSQQNTAAASVANASVAGNVQTSTKVQASESVTASANSNQTLEQTVVVQPTAVTTIDVVDDNATAVRDNAAGDNTLYGKYIVQSGDSLSTIAQQYGTSVGVLQDMNGIDGSLITVGQELRYPLPVN